MSLQIGSLSTLEELYARMEDGTLQGFWRMPEQVYRHNHIPSQSILKEKSAAKMRRSMQFPTEPTRAMQIGDAIHKRILEPDLFDQHYCLEPEVNKRTKAGKAEFALFQEVNKGKRVLSSEDFDLVCKVSDRVLNDPFAAKFFTGGHAELAMFARDPWTGQWFKGKMDYYLPDKLVIVDFKTTECAHEESFAFSFKRYGYEVQSAAYCDLHKLITGYEPRAYLVFAQEKHKDMDYNVFEVGERTIEAGRRRYLSSLMAYNQAFNSDRWDGYEKRIKDFDLPEYLLNRELDEHEPF